MKVLGITASLNFPYESNLVKGNTFGLGHDSAAVLVDDGKVIAAIEEERLNRIKHTNKAPTCAMKFCLESNNISLKDIDAVAVNFNEYTVNLNLKNSFLDNRKQKELYDGRYYIQRMIKEAFGEEIADEKIHFVPHHEAHAESTFAMCGFDKSLVLVTDGVGDDCAGIIQSRDGDKVELLYTIPTELSLGMFYLKCIQYLGYDVHDEYKVMGLAPYGDPKKYKRYFNKIIRLLPDGQYTINNNLYSLIFELGLPRRKGEPFTQQHKDIAASIQASLEEVIMHMLKYYQEKTGHTNLCLAGGVAHNCSVNGKILYSGLFENIFVQPACHDAGTALGAALHIVNREGKCTRETTQLDHVYWGTDIRGNDVILEELTKWDKFVSFEKVDNIVEKTAGLLAEGYILGWVQGRSEFGPRALGNRSIVADPRPEENKQIINQMVKKREGYRPFAPSVLEEYLNDFFVVPNEEKQWSLPFMNFVLDVKKDYQTTLGAITHVDGTARVQTVSKKTNQKYWELIDEFRKLTNIPIVLNTSFNNNAEPIVDSEEDSIVTYLTTKLHYLVIGDYFVSKKDVKLEDYLDMRLLLPTHLLLSENQRYTCENSIGRFYHIRFNHDETYQFDISEGLYNLLKNVDSNKSIRDLTNTMNVEDRKAIIEELISLWENRLIVFKP